MSGRIRIGCQTSFAASAVTEPFEYAVAQGFDAFEWFPDRRPTGEGWSETDLSADARAGIRQAARQHDIRLSVHGSWDANPLTADGLARLARQARFGADIGASTFVVHLEVSEGVSRLLAALWPLAGFLGSEGIELAFENTIWTGPDDFNDLFRETGARFPCGMCLDVGHANLYTNTRHDYLAYLDHLGAGVPISHVHLHENWGDADSHLAMFAGPAGRDDSGVRGLVDRLIGRGFGGCMILEQWPEPPSLLRVARDRLVEIIDARRCAGATSAGSAPL